MQAKELRTGNYLKYFIGEDGCDWDSTQVDWQDIKWCAENNGNFNKVHKPIPLSPSILEACGFVALKGWSKFWWKSDGVAASDVKKIDNVFRYKEFFIIYSFKDGRYFIGVNDIEINSLHQLQNAIFVLTGNELKVDTTKL